MKKTKYVTINGIALEQKNNNKNVCYCGLNTNLCNKTHCSL